MSSFGANARNELSTAVTRKHLAGIDSIRFWLALAVVFYHTGSFPLIAGIDTSTRSGKFVERWYTASVNGQGAVVTFFVISGLCIHLPYRNGGRPKLREYFARRGVRTVLPALGAILIARCFGLKNEFAVLAPSVLWSLVCEEIYYCLYPFLILPLRRRLGVPVLIACALLASECLAWGYREPWGPMSRGNYPIYGWHLNWILGLPCWLIGCALAESIDNLGGEVSGRRIWLWRLGIVAALCICERYREAFSHAHSLNYYCFLAYGWLKTEISYYRHRDPNPALEWAGKWSYSLYLTHYIANTAYAWLHPENYGHVANWGIHLAFMLLFAYVFFLLIERPAHFFARRIGTRAARPELAFQSAPPMGLERAA